MSTTAFGLGNLQYRLTVQSSMMFSEKDNEAHDTLMLKVDVDEVCSNILKEGILNTAARDTSNYTATHRSVSNLHETRCAPAPLNRLVQK